MDYDVLRFTKSIFCAIIDRVNADKLKLLPHGPTGFICTEKEPNQLKKDAVPAADQRSYGPASIRTKSIQS